ncbi:MAG: 50S ribosomal protein L17 [Actinomycetota bacterium]|nr:50S ribosomal protein L17 [Actinomycetota bacterium]
MPKPIKGPRLGAGPAHQRLMLAGLAAALIREERIRTTEAKARMLRPVADRLVTLGKSGTIHSRRRALMMIEDREVVHKLFAEVAPRFSERRGGYTRVMKLGPRKGDGAPMAIVEFVEEEARTAPSAEESKKRGIRRRRKQDEAKTETRGTAEATEAKAADKRPSRKKPAAEQAEPSRPTELVEAGEEAEEAAPASDTEVFMTGEPGEGGEGAGEAPATPGVTGSEVPPEEGEHKGA